jgi:hypothetical protein
MGCGILQRILLAFSIGKKSLLILRRHFYYLVRRNYLYQTHDPTIQSRHFTSRFIHGHCNSTTLSSLAVAVATEAYYLAFE